MPHLTGGGTDGTIGPREKENPTVPAILLDIPDVDRRLPSSPGYETDIDRHLSDAQCRL